MVGAHGGKRRHVSGVSRSTDANGAYGMKTIPHKYECGTKAFYESISLAHTWDHRAYDISSGYANNYIFKLFLLLHQKLWHNTFFFVRRRIPFPNFTWPMNVCELERGMEIEWYGSWKTLRDYASKSSPHQKCMRFRVWVFAWWVLWHANKQKIAILWTKIQKGLRAVHWSEGYSA